MVKSKLTKEQRESIIRTRRKNNHMPRYMGLKLHIYKVMKEAHPETTISKLAMSICESILNDIADKLCKEASQMLKLTGRKTLTSDTINSACKLLFTGEFKKYAQLEGVKAYTKYFNIT